VKTVIEFISSRSSNWLIYTKIHAANADNLYGYR
jgi:hypothetical protein